MFKQFRKHLRDSLQGGDPSASPASLRRELGRPSEPQQRLDERKANKLDREAAEMEHRAAKMAKKTGRGNIRAARAATTAESLRAQAERKRE